MDLLDTRAEDFGPFEDVTLPLHKQGLTWVGGDNKDTEAADNNGSGKSSLFKAVTWCLYGESIDGEKGDKVIRRGAKRAKVATRLRDDKGGIWTVVRERRKGTPSLQLIQPDGEPYPAAKDDVQAKIVDMVGLDYKAFKNTALYGQNDSMRFASPFTKDADRKDMLHRILRTDVLKGCHDWALNQGRALKGEIATIEGEITKLLARMEEHDLGAIQAEVQAFEDERAEAIEQHTQKARELRARAKEHSEDGPEGGHDEELATLAKGIKKLEAEAAAAEEAKKKALKLREPLEKLEEISDGLEAEANKELARAEALQAQLKRLTGDKCPVCTTPLAKGDAAKHKAEMEAELKANLAIRKELAAKLNKVQVEIEEKREAFQALDDKAEGATVTLRQISRMKDSVAAIEASKAKAREEARAREERSKRFIELAKKELESAKEWEGKTNPHAARLKASKAKIAEYKAERQTRAKRRDEKAVELAHIDFWIKGFGNQGLPSFILDSVMPYITERANEYLTTLSDGDITMHFSTQRELKSGKGEVRDEIQITWSVEGLEDSYPPSGGQLKKMEIATDLALMDLVATREGGHIDILMMDEVLDGLDAEGRQRVLQLLHELRKRRGSIFVISHDSEIAEIFEKSITVVKEGGKSRLEVA